MIPEVDYIIPISSPGGIEYEERLETLRYVINIFLARQTGIAINVVIVEQVLGPGSKPFLQGLRVSSSCHPKLVQVLFPVFNKCWLYNIGLRLSRNRHVFLADLDCVYLEDKLKHALEFAVSNKLRWCIAWDSIHYTGPRCKSKILANNVVDWSDCETVPEDKIEYDGYEGGLVYFERRFLVEELGGCNEFFRDLGEMDNSLAHSARVTSGQNRRFRSELFHLFHTVSPMKNSPLRPFNRQIMSYVRKNVPVCNLIMKKMWTNGLSGRLDSPACDRTSFNKERLHL